MSVCQMHLSRMKGHKYGPGINGRDLEQLTTCCAWSVTLQEPALSLSLMSKHGQKKSNHRPETFYFSYWACQLTLSGAGNPQWAHQQTRSCRGRVLKEGSAGMQSPPHSPGRAELRCRDSGSQFAGIFMLQKLLQGKQRRQAPAPGGNSVSLLSGCCMSVSANATALAHPPPPAV